jgi:hypothetical protein
MKNCNVLFLFLLLLLFDLHNLNAKDIEIPEEVVSVSDFLDNSLGNSIDSERILRKIHLLRITRAKLATRRSSRLFDKDLPKALRVLKESVKTFNEIRRKYPRIPLRWVYEKIALDFKLIKTHIREIVFLLIDYLMISILYEPMYICLAALFLNKMEKEDKSRILLMQHMSIKREVFFECMLRVAYSTRGDCDKMLMGDALKAASSFFLESERKSNEDLFVLEKFRENFNFIFFMRKGFFPVFKTLPGTVREKNKNCNIKDHREHYNHLKRDGKDADLIYVTCLSEYLNEDWESMSGKIPKELVEIVELLGNTKFLMCENFRKAFFDLILLHEKVDAYFLLLIQERNSFFKAN